jgi:hypothetical protein
MSNLVKDGSERPPGEAPLISFLKPSEIASYDPPDGALLVGDFHIVKGATFVIGGAPSVGKSRSAVALAQAGATTSRWFGNKVHRKFRTMILQTENGQHRLKMEFQDIPDDLEDHVRISPPPPLGMCWPKQEFREQLSSAITEFMPDVVIIDPWNASARDQTQKDYLDTFQMIQSVLPQGDDKPALGIVAHTRKPKAEERHSGRALMNTLAGSYVLSSVPRSIFVMQPASNDVEDQRIVWTCCKNNDGESGPRSAWLRRNGLFQAVTEFDWEEFDRGEGKLKLTWDKVPERLRENFCGLITKRQAVAFLVGEGVNDKTAYRWITKAVEAGKLKDTQGYLTL